MEETAARALRALLRELGAEGQIVPVSGYRTMEEQTQIYEDSLRENGGEFTKKICGPSGLQRASDGAGNRSGPLQGGDRLICPDFPYEASVRNFVKWRRITALWSAIRRARKRSQESVMSCTSAMWGGPHAADR